MKQISPVRFALRSFPSLAAGAALALTLAGPVLAASEPWLGKPLTADPKDVLAAAIEAGGLEEDGTRQLLSEVSISIDERGRQTTIYRQVYRILSAEALEEANSVESIWKPWRDEPPVLRARVIRPNGTVEVLDEQTIVDRPASSDPDIYDDRKERSAPLPGLELGAVVETEITEREKEPFYGGAHGYFALGFSVPVSRFRLTIDLPEGLALTYRMRGPVEAPWKTPRETRGTGRAVTVFERTGAVAVAEAEPAMPGDLERYPGVEWTTGASWEDMALIYTAIVEKRLAEGAFATPSGLAAPKSASRLERIDALLAWVQKEVRYTGLALDDGAMVPTPPKAVRARRYGDCKDQAVLLVMLLRAEGFDASVALLRAGTGLDVHPGLPALSGFNHAIVHVTAAEGLPDGGLFVDPTSPFHRAGSLPPADQGRLALVCRTGTNALQKTPESSAREDVEIEDTDVRFAAEGKGTLVETSRWKGRFEAAMRSSYDGSKDADIRKNLTRYVDENWGKAKFVRYSVSPSRVLTKPFVLVVEASGSDYVKTLDQTASFSASPAGVLRKFPWIRDEKRQFDLAVQPHRVEVSYRLFPPKGYVAENLPEPREEKLGPGRFRSEVRAEKDGSVIISMFAEIDVKRLAPAEAAGLRDDLKRVREGLYVTVAFQHEATRMLEAGRIAEGLAVLRREIGDHPSKAAPHRRLAHALLGLGLGEAARSEALEATRLEKDSALSWHQLGMALQHDALGRFRRKGWDPEGASSALAKAVALDPENTVALLDLAFSYEFDAEGFRYGPRARLSQVHPLYEAFLKKLPNRTAVVRQAAQALLLDGRAADAAALLRGRKDFYTDPLPALYLASVAIASGVDKAQTEARQLLADAGARRKALEGASSFLYFAREYPAGQTLLAEAARGAGARSAELTARLDAFSKMKRRDPIVVDDADPISVVRGWVRHALEGDEKGTSGLVHSSAKGHESLTRALGFRAAFVALALRGELPLDSVLDGGDSMPSFLKDGSVDGCWKVKGRFPAAGQGDSTILVWLVREEGKARIVATADQIFDLAEAATWSAGRGELAEARWLLDQLDDALLIEREEKPVTFSAFRSFWPVKDAAKDDILLASLAARAVLGLTPAERESLAKLTAGKEGERRVEMLLAQAAFHGKSPKEAATRLAPLCEKDPDSEDLAAGYVSALSRSNDLAKAEAFWKAHLARKPEHLMVKRVAAEALQRAGRLEEGSKIMDAILENPDTTFFDANNAAWYRMVAGIVDQKTLELAQRAVEGSQGGSAITLNTQAAVFAEAGRPAEARELVLRCLDLSPRSELVGADWLVLGRILESYGLKENARAAYLRAEALEDKTDDDAVNPGSVVGLVRKGLLRLGVEEGPAKAPRKPKG